MIEFIKEIFIRNAFSSLKLSVVIALLFILTKPITKRYTAGFRYYSWLAVMIVFLIPFNSMGISYKVDVTPTLINVRDENLEIRKWYDKNAPTYAVTEEVTRYDSENKSEPKQTETFIVHKRVDITAILALAWILGAIAYFGVHFKRYIYYKKSIRRLSSELNDINIYNILSEEKSNLEISGNLQIRISSVIDTPMLIGILHPDIVLPHSDYTENELRLILRHELFHFKRKDILYQFITLIFVSLHWFNPVVHIMAEAIEIDGETSCDEKTLENKPYEEKVFYGEMLLKFLKTETQKKSYMTTTFFGGKKGMKKRLTLIADKTARRKGSIAMAVVMIMTIMLSISAAAMNNEYFESVFEGDTSYLADFVKTEKKSVSDERFTLTLEQYLVAKGQIMVVYSFEAKTEDALEELRAVDENGHSTFWDMDTLNLAPTDFDKASCRGYGGYGNSDITKFNTDNKIYGILVCDSVENDEKVDFYLSTNKIKGNPKITIPMDYNMETKTVKFDDMIVEYNPISISVKYPFSESGDDCDECEWNGTYFYFRMENGELKTFNQLYKLSGGSSTFDENDNTVSWTAHAWARKIIKPDEIKSIILNGTEYPVDNPSSHTPIDIDSHLKPFIINSYVRQHLWLPLRELCDGLGAGIEWDGDTQSAKVEYRGSEYIFTVGSNSFFKDGDECTFYTEAPFIDENDRLIIPPRLDDYMGIDYHGYNSWVENGNLNPNAKWHVIP